MKYVVSNFTPKEWNSKKFSESTLTDETGSRHEKVSDWTGTITNDNQEVEGEVIKNEKGYYNFKKSESSAKRSLTGNMTRAVEKKAEMIEHAQENKSQSITNAGSITNATNLVTSMIEAGIISKEFSTETEIKNKVREYITWYRELYNNPQAVAPF